MKDANTNSFIFYTAYAEKLRRLTDSQLGALVRIMCAYKESGNAPEITDAAVAFAFDVVRYDMDRNSEKYETTVQARKEAGAKGGQAKVANANKSKQSQANLANATFAKQNKQEAANLADNENANDNDNDNDNIKRESEREKNPPPPNPPEEEQPELFGLYHNVRLKKAEFQTLMDTYPNDYREMIENLSGYMRSKGKVYDDHFATMMKWKREDEQKKKEQRASPKKTAFNNFAQRDNTDLDEDWSLYANFQNIAETEDEDNGDNLHAG